MSEIFTLRYVFVFIDNFGVENKSGACEGSNIVLSSRRVANVSGNMMSLAV